MPACQIAVPARPMIVSIAALTVLAAITVPTSATLLNWNNAAGGAASTAANWSPVQIPAAADDLTFNLVNTYTVSFNNTVFSSNTHTYRRGSVTLNLTSPHTAGAGITVGDLSGDAATMILTTGTLNSNAGVVVGDATGSTGTLRVNDDDADLILNPGGNFLVGNSGNGTLEITGSGLVEVADHFIVGTNASSTATVTISGFQVTPFAASSLNVLGLSQSRIGQSGDATMTISDGALANFAGDVVIANNSGSISSVTVEDQGLLDARFNVDGDLHIGRNTSITTAAGNGTLTVNNGGAVDVGDTLFVGGDANAGVGTLSINTGGDVLTTNMQVSSGGQVSLNGGTLASDNAIVNTASGVISGTGTINADINNAGSITPLTTAGLTINGILNNTTNSVIGSKIHFGPGGGYTGSGSCQTEIAGDTAATITATGTLSLGKNTTAGVSYNGALDVGGNIVTLVDSNQAVLGGLTTINSGRIECSTGIGLQNGATIRGDGLFVGDVVAAGLLDPHSNGNLGGLFTVQGDLLMNPTGSVDIEIGGTPSSSSYDKIVVSGTATFDGTLRLRVKNGYTPQAGQQFILINASGGRIGEFDSLQLDSTSNSVCNGVTFVLVYSSTAAIVLVRPPDADTDNDNDVDADDLLAVITGWGPCGGGSPNPPCPAGNVDGVDDVEMNDLLIVISHWGPCP